MRRVSSSSYERCSSSALIWLVKPIGNRRETAESGLPMDDRLEAGRDARPYRLSEASKQSTKQPFAEALGARPAGEPGHLTAGSLKYLPARLPETGLSYLRNELIRWDDLKT